MDGHSSIVRNITGDWTLFCTACSYEEKFAVPIGDVVIRGNELVNEHPLGDITLFDAGSLTFFKGLRTAVEHCKRQKKQLCWRCRKPCKKAFCARCIPYVGEPTALSIETRADLCLYCGKTMAYGFCRTCRPEYEENQILTTF